MVGQEGSSTRTVGKSAPSSEVVQRADELTGRTMRWCPASSFTGARYSASRAWWARASEEVAYAVAGHLGSLLGGRIIDSPRTVAAVAGPSP